MLAALLAIALAAAQSPDDEFVSEELFVYGELRVEQARQQVIANLEKQGFTVTRDKGDHVLMRHESPWRGDVLLYDDGWMRVKRQPVRIEGREMPWAERNTALAWMGCVVWVPLCIRPAGQTQSGNKWGGHRAGVVQRLDVDMDVFGDRVADLAVDRQLETLPERLEALWRDGRPLEGEGVLQTPAARRRALLGFWESRVENAWGDRVRESVEGFIRGVVQHSEHPFSTDEVAQFNARTSAERPLRIDGVD